MLSETKQSLAEGAIAGGAAGTLLVVASACTALVAGHDPMLPLQLSASTLLGPESLTEPPQAAFIVGIFVALTFATYFGFVYGAIVSFLAPRVRASWVGEGAIGAAFGLMVWLLTFPILGRWMYPWIGDAPQFVAAVLFALAYGLPLGVFVAIEEHVPRDELRTT